MSMQVQKVVNLLLVSSSAFFAGVSLSLLAPFYPDEALLKGVTVTQSGIVIGSVYVTTLIFTPLFGKYLELLGARRFLILGSAVVGVGNFVFAFLEEVEDKN